MSTLTGPPGPMIPDSEIELLDGRAHAHAPVGVLAGMRDRGHVREVARQRLHAFELNRPLRVLTARGEQMGHEGDILIVSGTEAWIVERHHYDRWYEPASEHDDGARGSHDVLAAIRLALLGAADDRAATRAIEALVSLAPPSDQGRVEPVDLLVRIVQEVRALEFTLVTHRDDE